MLCNSDEQAPLGVFAKGDDVFSAKFDDTARDMGMDVTRVISGNDVVPTVMTKVTNIRTNGHNIAFENLGKQASKPIKPTSPKAMMPVTIDASVNG